MTVLSAVLAAGLALTHILAGSLHSVRGEARSRWLSAAGGAAVAYVFVHTLPELEAGQAAIEAAGWFGLRFIETHVYLVALIGFVTFYGLDRAAVLSRMRRRRTEPDAPPHRAVFHTHIASFAAYYALIGYLLLHREEPGATNLVLFAFAMGLHFLVNDYGLRELHQSAYHDVGRWVLAAAVAVGWLVGLVTTVDSAFLAVLFAFLAGGVILNTIKEELPEERDSSFWSFALGAGAYTAIVLIAV